MKQLGSCSGITRISSFPSKIFGELKCSIEAKCSCVSLFHLDGISVSLALFPSGTVLPRAVSFNFTSSSHFLFCITPMQCVFFFFAVVFGHKPFCWLNICYLVVYLFTLPHPHSLSILSSVFLCCHPPCLFPFSIPIASKLSKLLLSLLLAFVLFPPPPPSRRASHAFSDIAWRWSSSMLSCPA